MAHKAGMKASIKAKVAAHKAHRLPTRPRLKQRLLHIRLIRRIRKVIGFIDSILLMSRFCQLKFIYSEKATKFCEIFHLLLTNKFVFFVSRYSFELQSLFVWFSVLKLNSLRWLLVYKLSQCLKHSKHCQNLAMFGMFE